ncbi:Phage integrase family protein [Micromonospora rhizosphaerae]|uniref:Phage integrase family protein n=1 Tax=Micromonospora rhizosphaerae TaxID=568872 RepID=A0A1C6SDD3_9ACTN|nr:Phage integrase family protein [Micromonospora rhizosphaerae]
MKWDLSKMTSGLSPAWVAFLVDWDRSLRSGNYPSTTRYNYLLAVIQLGRYLAEQGCQPEAVAAAGTPIAATRRRIEAFQTWMIETRSAATALNKHKALQQFFKWLMVDEGEICQTPMLRVRQPKTPERLIPIIRDEDTKKILDTCKGREFVQLRDEAIIRVLCNTGARLSEVANLNLEDVDLSLDSVRYHGKGAKDRRVRIGPKTARAVSRYLRGRHLQRRQRSSEEPPSRAGVPAGRDQHVNDLPVLVDCPRAIVKTCG